MPETWTPHGSIHEAAFKDNGKKLRIPPASEIAAAIRAGETTYDDFTRTYKLGNTSLRRVLNLAGYANDGTPRVFNQPPKRTPVVNFLEDNGTAAWLDDAACAGMNPDDFFPERGAYYTAARAACAACPVAAQCLEAAMREERGAGITGRFGMRGGMTPEDRHRLEKEAVA